MSALSKSAKKGDFVGSEDDSNVDVQYMVKKILKKTPQYFETKGRCNCMKQMLRVLEVKVRRQ